MRSHIPALLSSLVIVCGAVFVSPFGVAPAGAAPVSYNAFLDGPSEEPPNASPGTGTALVTIDAVAHTMVVTVDFADLIGTTTVSHIHVINGPGDANVLDTVGPVATTTPTFPGFPVGVTSGNYNQVFDMTLAGSYNASWITDSGGTTAQAEAELFSAIDEGRAYFNIHSSVFPGGEIRGFLQIVPEPSSVALAICGAALVVHAGVARRRKRTPR